MIWEYPPQVANHGKYTVGIAVSLDDLKMHVYVNGVHIGDQDFDSKILGDDVSIKGLKYFPAVSCANFGGAVLFNCGQFRFKCPQSNVRGFVDTTSGDWPFIAAAREGRADVCNLLFNSLNFNDVSEYQDTADGRTVLHILAATGGVSHLWLLAGLDPNKEDAVSQVPALLAAANNHVESLAMLIVAGATFNTDFKVTRKISL